MNGFATTLAAILFALAGSGCCTMIRGRTQIVDVTSTPAGARATVQPGGDTLVTPGTIVLARKSSYVVRLEKVGYASASVTLTSHASSSLWRNVVWIHPIGWTIGVGVDLGNGSGYDLVPGTVTVALTPDGPRAESP
jgi:hypothetical protein